MNLVIAAVGFLSLVVIVLAIALAVALRRITVSATGAPTPREEKIRLEAQNERATIIKETTASGAEVRRLTDAELERSINSRYDDR